MANSNSSANATIINNQQSIDLALDGQHPGLLINLLTPGLTDLIYLTVECSSRPDYASN